MEPRLRNSFLPNGLKNMRFSAGFTFIETMIVFLLMGIITMVAWPTLNGAVNDSRLSGAAEEVVTALEFAQMTAMSSGRQMRVTIDDTADTILVEQFTSSADFTQNTLSEADVEGGAFATMGNPLNRGTDYNISLQNEDRFNGVDITSASFGGNNWVVFDEFGAPTSGGAATLVLAAQNFAVNLDSLTGKVTLSN